VSSTSTLVIVESPAKAKTIAGYLGKGYDVHASFGHVRDLPERADDVPASMRGVKWAKLGVDVEGDFSPLYIVPEDKKRHVEALKRAAKGAKSLLLATDEDREGESISWHVVQLLKPAKGTTVKRIVFHEITPEAIQDAIKEPRAIDEDLVRAQETRRILDRLYGYTISPVLWRKVAPKLSAGRVQSVAVKLLVDRERERMTFKRATWWDLEATLAAAAEGGRDGGSFTARLSALGGRRIASGKSFDPTTGALVEKEDVLLDEARARALADLAAKARPWRVAKLETRPETEKPPVPFMTSTLQQEANRKLRFSSKRTMQIAQQLYEGVDLGGERAGLITYMRTDSLTLSERALSQARDVIRTLYGKEYLPAEPVRYRTKSKNAQEAHEAIRPTDLGRRPEDVRRFLDPDQLRLYELVWKRTIACQMVPAKVLRTSVTVEVDVPGAGAGGKSERLSFAASGKQIVFPGFLRAYVEGSDDPEAELESKEALLPPLAEGKTVDARKVDALGHETKPPARLTEASLVKKLEEAGVGRPSTYASIISTIQDRGYVFKNGNELVPTFTAFAVTELLEENFEELVDLRFTARMEDELDEIAEGKRDATRHLAQFYRGDDGGEGLVRRVEERTPEIGYPAIPLGKDPGSGDPIVVRVGRFGTYVQRGEGGKGNTVTIPEDTVPADLTIEKVLHLLHQKSQGPVPVGKDPATGRDVVLRSGRFGSYLEVAQTEAEAKADEKPRRVSIPEGLDPMAVTQDDVTALLSFPRLLGKHAELSDEVKVHLGRYGAYVACGKETRNVASWRAALAMTLAQAKALLAQPKQSRRRGAAPAAPPIKEFGKLEGAEGPVKVLEGRWGPYVSDGETHATLPKGTDPAALTPEEAISLLLARKAAPKRAGKRGARGRAAGKATVSAGAGVGRAKKSSRK
jgi:DNA topoisomerase-1